MLPGGGKRRLISVFHAKDNGVLRRVLPVVPIPLEPRACDKPARATLEKPTIEVVVVNVSFVRTPRGVVILTGITLLVHFFVNYRTRNKHLRPREAIIL